MYSALVGPSAYAVLPLTCTLIARYQLAPGPCADLTDPVNSAELSDLDMR